MLTTPTWKTWALRIVVFTAGAALGSFCAISALWVMMWVATFVFGDVDLFMALFTHWGWIGPVALLCGTIIGLAAASGSTWSERPQRGLVAGVALFVLLAIPITAWAAWPEPDFDPAAFRQAMAARDDDRLEIEAYRAVDQDALVGKTKDEIRALLGSPDRATRGRWSWSVGMINDFLGPGDGGALHVRFRGDRVVSAEVAVG